MRLILQILFPYGSFVIYFGCIMFLPAIFSFFKGDGLHNMFFIVAGSVIAIGLVLVGFGRWFRTKNLLIRHGFLLITIMWSTMPIFGAVPLMLSIDGLAFSAAYFEASSGLTASGATALSGLDQLPDSVNFWRALMSWIGGMGLVVLATAILPVLGVGGSGAFQAEVTGPIKETRITPKLSESAKLLWYIYTALTLLCAVCYKIAGMTVFDSMIHAFTTMSLGGFSSHDQSFIFFDSPAIEAVAIFFMLLAGMNFGLHFIAWTHRDFRVYVTNIEWRFYLLLVVCAVSISIVYLAFNNQYDSVLESVRYGTFNAVSIITTTGYSNENYGAWPLFLPVLLLFFANFTSCSGSTGGGVKLMRALITVNQINAEQQKLVHPLGYYNNKLKSNAFPAKTIASILFFILAYVFTVIIITLLFLLTDLDILTSFSSAVSSLSNTGPGLGEVGPASNYSDFTAFQKSLFSFSMIFGRLEMLSFIAVLGRQFWRF